VASFSLPVSDSEFGFGAIVYVGATQDNVTRQFQLDGEAADSVGVLQSADNFVTDSQPVTTLVGGGGGPSLVQSIAMWYRTVRMGIADPSSPHVNCWMSDAVANGSGGTPTGGAANVVTYQQGGTPNAAQGIYPSFASALTVARAMSQANPTIVIDPTFGTPVIPPGTYNVAGMHLAALAGAGAAAQIDVQDGAVLELEGSTLEISDGLIVNFKTTTTPAIHLPTGGKVTLINLDGLTARNSGPGPGSALIMDSAATVPAIVVAAGALFIQAEDAGTLASLGASALISVGAAAGLGITLDALAQLGANVLSSSSGVVDVSEANTTAVVNRSQSALTSPSVTWSSYPLLGAVASGSADLSNITPLVQRIPPGEASATDTTPNLGRGQIQPATYRIAQGSFSFVGDAGNTHGQMASLQVYVDGVLQTLTIPTLPTTAGKHTAEFALGDEAFVGSAGQVVTLALVLSADLDADLSNITAAVGP